MSLLHRYADAPSVVWEWMVFPISTASAPFSIARAISPIMSYSKNESFARDKADLKMAGSQADLLLVSEATSKPKVQNKERLSPGARLSSFCEVAV